MADHDETTTSGDEASELRGTLVRRLAMAAVLVAILLGVLAFFDHVARVPEEPEVPVFTEPVPVAPQKDVSQPVTSTETPPEPAADAVPAEAPPPPVVEGTPVVAGGAGARPGPVRPAGVPATAPVAEETAPPQPLAPAASPPKPPAAARLFSGFILQAGVFSSPQLAEELRAKLTLSGVPSSIETRVQVGPFRTRQEAEAAQARLKALGIQTLLIAPAGRR